MVKKIFKQMMVTQIISGMTVMIGMLLDSLTIGRFIGVDAMTAYGLATPVLLVFAAFGSMLSSGIQVMCGKTLGEGDADSTNVCFSVSVTLSLIVAAIGFAAVMIFTEPICTLLGAGKPSADNQIFYMTCDYIRGYMIGAPAFILALIMVPYMQISGNRTRLVIAVIAMTVTNAALNFISVLALDAGIFGVGLASAISYFAAFGIGVGYFFKKGCMFRFRAKYISAKKCLELISYGIPTVINQISMVLLVFLLNKILLGVGQSTAVAAYSVISTVGNFCYCVGSGIAAVALLLSSVYYSDEDRSSLRSVVKTMLFWAAALDLILIALVLIFAPWLIRIFLVGNGDAREMAILGARLFSLSLLASAINSSFKNYCQGIERVKLTCVISVLQNFVFTCFFAFLLSRFFGTTGVWLGFLCGESATLIFLAVFVWIREKRITLTLDALTLLPRRFGVSEENCFVTSVDSVEGAVRAAEQAEYFCLSRGVGRRDSAIIALCIEDMTVNSVVYGFPLDKINNVVNVRLVLKGDKKIICIRDDCVNFDPLGFFERHKNDDPTKHIAIRMVVKLSKSAKYVNSLGLNNLTLVM